MAVRLKKLSDQVVVITGASSGIGLATARMAAARGARVVLAGRNEAALRNAAAGIRAGGGEAEPVVADVGRAEDMRRVADAAVGRFGAFDTWVNNAGISIFGTIERTPLADHRRLFETNYFGVVRGSLVAVEHLRTRGGALINIGSALSDRAVPYQGAYCASKHAVKGFTDALRMELEADGLPISVTLIKPASIDTPLPEHARSYMPSEPRLPPPVYAPELAAEAILYAAEHPVRDLYVGGAGRMLAATRWFPRLTDRVMERTLFGLQQTGRPVAGRPHDGLHESRDGGRERSRQDYFTRERSLYTAAELHPVATAALVTALGIAAGAAIWRRTARRRGV